MIEYRLQEKQERLSLESPVRSLNFQSLHRDKMLECLEKPGYACFQTLKNPLGRGEQSVFVMEDRLYLRMADLISFLPVSLYLSLVMVYLTLSHPPAYFEASTFMDYYLQVLQVLLGTSGTANYGFSYFTALIIWLLTAGFFTLVITSVVYTALAFILSFLPSRIYRFLRYQVLGILIKEPLEKE